MLALYCYTVQKETFKIQYIIKSCHHSANASVLYLILKVRSVLPLWTEDLEIFIIVWWMYVRERRDTGLFTLKSRRKVSFCVLRVSRHSPHRLTTKLKVTHWPFSATQTEMSRYKMHKAVRASETKRERASIQSCEFNLWTKLENCIKHLRIKHLSISCVQENKFVTS